MRKKKQKKVDTLRTYYRIDVWYKRERYYVAMSMGTLKECRGRLNKDIFNRPWMGRKRIVRIQETVVS